jgi:SAM-dependent methyltransferase
MVRYTQDREVLCLQKYAAKAYRGIVEIGVLDGDTTRKMAEVSGVMIYGIDPLIPDSMDKNLVGNENSIRENMRFYPRFNFIKDYSYNVVHNFTGYFDFIFIDGSHEYEDVKRDVEEWTTILEPHGFFALHDSAPVEPGGVWFGGWPGPTRLAEELKEGHRFNFIERVDTIHVFQKP